MGSCLDGKLIWLWDIQGCVMCWVKKTWEGSLKSWGRKVIFENTQWKFTPEKAAFVFLACSDLFYASGVKRRPMGIDQWRQSVQACCGGRAAAFSCWDPGPMGPVGGGLAEVTRSSQDRTRGIWAQDCGSWAPFVPSFTFFLTAPVL